mgnify:FL=1
MNKELFIEIFGYIGSFLVLISFLMTSVVKLRIVNTVGSVIFMIYAFIIKSYPTAVMNFFLVLINLRFLWKSRNTDKVLDLVKAEPHDQLLLYLLDYYQEDIQKCFPSLQVDLKKADQIYVVSCDGKPAGITLGKRDGDAMELLLDYSIPEYRDFSIGQFLMGKYSEEGITKLIYRGPDENHISYLTKMGFVKKDGGYEKAL